MDRSKLSNVLSTTRLLPYFSNDNVDKVRSCLYHELGCENESQFVCKILKSVYKTMTNQSLANIKNKVMEIADQQQIQLKYKSTGNVTTNTNTVNRESKRNMTVYKYIQQQYNDPLSRLHSDIIDYFGTFLNKKQSIEFGYLNKQLYIETQKQSYLLKRCKDKIWMLDKHRIDKIFLGKSDAFNYTFPRRLILHASPMNQYMIKQMHFFSNFFRRLNVLNCWNAASSSCVPLKFLLNKNSNYYSDSASQNTIQKLRFSLFAPSTDVNHTQKIDTINSICKKFDNINIECKDMRNIEKFEWSMPWCSSDANDSEKMQSVLVGCKQVLIRFGGISKSIQLENCQVMIDTLEEMKSIFHSNLKHLHLLSTSKLTVNIDNDSNNDDKNDNNDNNIGNIQSISLDTQRSSNEVEPAIETLNNLDKFSMRKKVKCYTIHWEKPRGFDNLNFGDAQALFDKIFFQDYDNHPLLQQITIKVSDDVCLFGLARLLLYFNQHYKELFVERKLYLSNFNKIEIVYFRIHGTTQLDGRYISTIQLNVGDMFDNIENSEILRQTADKEYSIEDKVIEIKQVKQGVESFGTIYKNVLHWLHSRQLLDSRDVGGCKIVFVL